MLIIAIQAITIIRDVFQNIKSASAEFTLASDLVIRNGGPRIGPNINQIAHQMNAGISNSPDSFYKFNES